MTVRQFLGLPLPRDMGNTDHIFRRFNLPRGDFPEHMKRRDGEGLKRWRDRLRHESNIPTILSALSDSKYCFVEQINPLLSRRVLDVVRSLPDHLREGKGVVKRIVREFDDEVEIASLDSNRKREDIMKDRRMVRLIRRELESDDTRVFSEEFIRYVLDRMKRRSNKKKFSLKGLAIKVLPMRVKNFLKDNFVPVNLDPNILAFRVFIVVRMKKMLKEDGKG